MKDIVKQVYRDLAYSSEKMSLLRSEMKEDFRFELGKQWDDADVTALESQGIKALTINKIKPIIKLLTGIERQSKTDFAPFPEGGEDLIVAEIVKKLLKNIVKNSDYEIKTSDVFKSGCICGMCFLEPYVDYSFDIINGDMKFKKISPFDVFLDPNFQEYDLSDSKFLIKVSWDLSKDDLLALFPDDKSKIEKIENGNIDFERLKETSLSKTSYTEDYPSLSDTDAGVDVQDGKRGDSYDLIDYYYKEMKKRYFAIISEKGIIEEFEEQDDAEVFVEQFGGIIIERNVPVIMHAQIVGNTEMYNGKAWSYPRYRSFPMIPFFADLTSEKIDNLALTIQGVVRGLKDLNLEFNKRRTQELRHLNSSANSGFEIEENQLSDEQKDKLTKFGSSAGIVIERRAGTLPIGRITPMPLSQGHAQLAAENASDLKQASGVDPDLLASTSNSQSGRAILAKQRQGLVMIQEMLDNHSISKQMGGKFMLSQLPDLYTLETAKKVLGSAYITENFTVPVSVIVDRALVKIEQGEELTELEQDALLTYPNAQQGVPVQNEDGSLVSTVDTDTADRVIESVLTNQELAKYDLSIGEGAYQETTRLANFMDIKELAQQGVPIPPQTLIELSAISEGDKKKIINQLAAAQAQPQAE